MLTVCLKSVMLNVYVYILHMCYVMFMLNVNAFTVLCKINVRCLYVICVLLFIVLCTKNKWVIKIKQVFYSF